MISLKLCLWSTDVAFWSKGLVWLWH